jgi:hypothetical protein
MEILGITGINKEKISRIADNEVSSDVLRVKLMTRYNSYFSHWRDYTILLAFLAFLGLYISLIDWEATFTPKFRAPTDNAVFDLY